MILFFTSILFALLALSSNLAGSEITLVDSRISVKSKSGKSYFVQVFVLDDEYYFSYDDIKTKFPDIKHPQFICLGKKDTWKVVENNNALYYKIPDNIKWREMAFIAIIEQINTGG